MAAPLPPSARLSTPPAWALTRVPGLESGADPLRVERLDGGSVNEVFRVDSRSGAFVLRLNGAAWLRPGVDRWRERRLHEAAAAAGIAPRIVAADPDREGLLITQFESGRLWRAADYSDVTALHRLGERLATLHALPAPAVTAFDPWSIAQQYLAQIATLALPAPPLEPLARLERCCRELLESAQSPCIAHGDLAQNNLLDGTRLWLLDWEYAQCSDALMDIACVLAYYPVARPYAGELTAAAGLPPRPSSAELAPRLCIYESLSWLWRLARGETAEPP